MMGLPADSKVALIPSMLVQAVEIPDDPVDRLIRCNPAIAVDRALYHTAEQTLRREVREQYPDIELGGGYGNEDDDRLLLGVSMPIPLLNRNRGGIAQAEAQREMARIEAEATFERLLQELHVALDALSHARVQRIDFESTVVPLLADQAADVERLIGLGEVSTLLLLETVTREYDSRSRLLELLTAESVAATTVTELLGPDLSTTSAAQAVRDSEESAP